MENWLLALWVLVAIGAALTIIMREKLGDWSWVALVVLAIFAGVLAYNSTGNSINNVDTFAMCARLSGDQRSTCIQENKDKPKSTEAVVKAITEQN